MPGLELIALIVAFLIALTVHESAHALVAYWLGDPTAKIHGRISLNPIRHLDPLGTLLLFIVHFGWGKPVPVNPQNLRSPLRDQALISLAGPMANFLTAMVMVMMMKYFFIDSISGIGFALKVIFSYTISLNLALMIFNLIPIPPLDGSKVLFLFLGKKLAFVSEWLETNGPAVLFAIILLSNFFHINTLSLIITRGVDFVLTALYL